MKLNSLKEMVDRLMGQCELNHVDPSEVVVGIKVFVEGAIGPTPITEVKTISLGIDWDHKKCLVTPTDHLRKISSDEMHTLRKQHTELGWEYYHRTRKTQNDE